ncbi:chlorophyll(ide) b reductase NYC1 protein [Artemisia annua]|uniref:Chlorophyll(Ide) b reductase NYC1 protein n=1 Tax=Artemisia annua TaxID=35608 RepID=A0A2U1KTA3_ARTAN|nr:chlorophyll(ide) b reductase NYC1 protein [Artemisia annua]
MYTNSDTLRLIYETRKGRCYVEQGFYYGTPYFGNHMCIRVTTHKDCLECLLKNTLYRGCLGTTIEIAYVGCLGFRFQGYESTKCGLRQLQSSLLKECRKSKVGVHTTSPAMVLTELLLRVLLVNQFMAVSKCGGLVLKMVHIRVGVCHVKVTKVIGWC